MLTSGIGGPAGAESPPGSPSIFSSHLPTFNTAFHRRRPPDGTQITVLRSSLDAGETQPRLKTTMASPFRIEVAREDDIPEIMTWLITAFEHIPSESLLGNISTARGFRAAGERHAHAWRQHALESSMPCAIKCVHTDSPTGEETIVGFAEWFIYDRPRAPEQYHQPHYLLSAAWVPNEDGKQGKVQRWLQPVTDARVKWMGGRPYAVLMYMCVNEKWRRKGVSTLCVKWGLERCEELGIPAYLEASDEGEPVYKKLGFVQVERVKTDFDGDKAGFPAMIWWPPKMSEEKRKPVEQV